MAAHGAVHDGEAEPAPREARGEERVEDALRHLRRHAVAVVLDGDLGRGAVEAERRLVPLQRDANDLGARVGGVDDEVQQHLFDLGRIGDHADALDRRVEADLDAAARRRRQHRQHLLHEGAQVERHRRRRTVAAVGLQLLAQTRRLPAGGVDRVDAGHRFRVLHLQPQQFGVAEHAGQQVVEVVGHAGGQRAQALGLLHLAHALLHAVARLLRRLGPLDLRGHLAVGPQQPAPTPPRQPDQHRQRRDEGTDQRVARARRLRDSLFAFRPQLLGGGFALFLGDAHLVASLENAFVELARRVLPPLDLARGRGRQLAVGALDRQFESRAQDRRLDVRELAIGDQCLDLPQTGVGRVQVAALDLTEGEHVEHARPLEAIAEARVKLGGGGVVPHRRLGVAAQGRGIAATALRHRQGALVALLPSLVLGGAERTFGIGEAMLVLQLRDLLEQQIRRERRQHGRLRPLAHRLVLLAHLCQSAARGRVHRHHRGAQLRQVVAHLVGERLCWDRELQFLRVVADEAEEAAAIVEPLEAQLWRRGRRLPAGDLRPRQGGAWTFGARDEPRDGGRRRLARAVRRTLTGDFEGRRGRRDGGAHVVLRLRPAELDRRGEPGDGRFRLLGESLREFLGALFLPAQHGGQQAEDERGG